VQKSFEHILVLGSYKFLE